METGIMPDMNNGKNEGMAAGLKLIGLTVIIAAAVLMYAPVVHHEFVYDDFILVNKNTDIENFNADGIRHIFFGRSYQTDQPLLLTAFAAIRHYGGNIPEPFHIVNIVFHAVNSALVFFLAGALAGLPGKVRDPKSIFTVSFTAALVFAIHPLHIESVTWISGFKELLSTFFSLCAMLAYIRYRTSGMAMGFPVIVLLFCAALLSKLTTLFLPIAFIFFDLLNTGKSHDTPKSHRIFEHIFIIFIAGAYTALNYSMAADKQMISVYAGGSQLTHIATILKIIPFNLKMSVWPWPMSVIYDIPAAKGLLDAGVLVSAGVIVFLAAAFFRCFRGAPAAAFGIAFFVLAFGATLNIVPTGILSADRYAYLPLFGFCLVAGLAVDRIAGSGMPGPALVSALLAITVGLCFSAAYARNADWKNPVSLWEATVKTAPDSAKAHMSLGVAYMDADRQEEAFEHLTAAIELDPFFPKAYVALSLYYRKAGETDKAFEVLKKGLHHTPEELELHYNIGIVYFEQEAYISAARIMNIVFEIYPGYKNSNHYFNASLNVLVTKMGPEEFQAFTETLSKEMVKEWRTGGNQP